MGLPATEIRAGGGGGRSALWRAIQAGLLGRDVLTLNVAEGPAYGAALLAGVGTGAWPSVEAACDQVLHVTSRTRPAPDDAAVYARGYPLYRELYARLAPLFPRLTSSGSIRACARSSPRSWPSAPPAPPPSPTCA